MKIETAALVMRITGAAVFVLRLYLYLELNELVKACEEEFGVSAAAGVVVAAAAGDGAGSAVEKDEFDVELVSAGASKFKVIKVVRENTGLGLKEAKEVEDGVSKAEDEDIKA